MIKTQMGVKIGKALFTEGVRHKAIFGGRGGEKSWATATYLISRAAQARKQIVCARQFQNSIKNSSKELIEKRIRALDLNDQFTVTDQSIVHNETFSNFLFVGLERNVESIRSLEGADIVWVEEARTISAKSMEILLPTVRAAGSELIWTWNPIDPTDPVDAYFRGANPPPNSIVVEVNYLDNPFFDKSALPAEMELMRKNNPERYKHVWLGHYDISYESKVFTNVTIGRPEVPPNTPPRYGLDFGFGADPSAVVKLYVIEATKQIYIAREAYGRVTMDQLPTLINSIVGDRGDLIRANSSQPGIIEFLRSRGFGAVGARKGAGSVREGVMLLQGYQWIVDPDCEQMRGELHRYSWPVDKLTGRVISGVNPIDANNHLIDCCRYACEDLITDAPLDDDDGGVLLLPLWRVDRSNEPWHRR